ncbi:MAG TPA: FUSC family protein [Candidatus Sulfotelmatobacter sp.]
MPDPRFGLGISRTTVYVSARAATASVLSMLLARTLNLPEFYWAPISTVVIILSTINPWTLAWQRFVGTALGAVLGAIIAGYVRPEWAPYLWIIYGLGIFVAGIFSALFRIGTAYRFAAITLTIVLLIAHSSPPRIVALHRFIEVSLGIVVALIVAAFWRIPDATA